MAASNSTTSPGEGGAFPFLAGVLGELNTLSPADLLKDASWARIAATGALVTASAAVLYRKKLVLWLCDYLASSRPNPGADYLQGIYGPVHEEVHSTELEVLEGEVPEGLEGAFVRTGPNSMFKPTGSYHIFDGDGMMHTVKLGGGRALSYSNRWVETARLKQEKAAGRALFAKIGDMWGKAGLALVLLEKYAKQPLGVVDMSQGRGTANTALVYHAKRLLALNEGDLPYQLRILCNGVLETVGRITVAGGDGEGEAYPGPFTAHPKVDPRTGEMFYFGYSMEKKPYVRGGMMDAKGTVTKQWAVDAPYPSMMHDCGMTEHYAVLLQLPLTFLPKKMIKENTLPLGFDASLPSRIGLLRRDAPGLPPGVSAVDPAAPPAPVTWVDIPNSFIFHVANCWEDEQGLVHLVACRYDKFNFHGFTPDSKEPYPQDERPKMTDIVLDPASGKMVSLTTLSALDVDFPVVHPELATRRTRYVWGATMDFDGQLPLFVGIAKFDLSLPAGEQTDACVGHIVYPAGVIGGEAVFVPRPNQASEDDGWLLVYVTQDNGHSEMHVYDARTMAQTPLARVRMPQRVPFGFHGTFVRKDQLDAHRTTL